MEAPVESSAVYVVNGVACFDTADGNIVPVSAATTLKPIGIFESSGTGDGSTNVGIRLLAPVQIIEAVNGGDSDADATDRGSLCYLLEGAGALAVTMDDTSRSAFGMVYGVSGTTVYVAVNMGPQGPQGPQGDPG